MGAPSDKTDRRRSERFSQSLVIHAQRHGPEVVPQEKITGILRDISGNGISFLSDAHYAVGDTLELEIDLPASHHHLLVQVARVEVLGDSKIIGVYFLDMSSEHEKALLDSLFMRQQNRSGL